VPDPDPDRDPDRDLDPDRDPDRDRAGPRVLMITTTFCVFCTRAKMLLAKRGIAYVEREIGRFDDASRRALRAETGGLRTFPMIRVGARWIGGMRELYELDRSGGLAELVARRGV
jgi:glutaredoxin 3